MFSSPLKKFKSLVKEKSKECNSAEKKKSSLIEILKSQIEQDNIDVFEKYPHIRQRMITLLEQFTQAHQLKEDNFYILQQKLQREITFQLNKLRNNNKISLLDNLYQKTTQSPIKSPIRNIRLTEGRGLSPLFQRKRAQSGMVEKDFQPQEKNQRPKSSFPKKVESSPVKVLEVLEAEEGKEELTATFLQAKLAEEEEMIGNNSSLPYSFLKMMIPETENQSKDNEFYEEIKKILGQEEEYEQARVRELQKLERQANEEISSQWQEQIELKKKEEQIQREHSKEMRKNIDYIVQNELQRERESVSKKKRQAVEERIKAWQDYNEEKRKAKLLKMEQIDKERRQLEQSMIQSQQIAQTNRSELLNKQLTQQKLLADYSNLAYRIKQSQQQILKDQQLKILKDGIAMQHERDSRQFQERYSLLNRGKKYFPLRQSVSPMKNI